MYAIGQFLPEAPGIEIVHTTDTVDKIVNTFASFRITLFALCAKEKRRNKAAIFLNDHSATLNLLPQSDGRGSMRGDGDQAFPAADV